MRIIAAPGTTRRSGDALRRHLLRAESSIVDGIRATGIDQTVLDCLRHGMFSQGLAVADSALHWELTTKDALTEHFAAAGARIGGIRGARRALAHADGRAENGGESLARAIMIERGFSVPELQVHVEDPVEPGALRRVISFGGSRTGRRSSANSTVWGNTFPKAPMGVPSNMPSGNYPASASGNRT